ncbi:phosphoribosylanthranilate isomerase [Sphingobacterium gobiense]|uniref:N-(5'-phosphoribosyl)anthranilate isomerase n=1 Tax=Sphingobacterium gobiense TaxID=1382456 RepID=A0A2S9JN16_9SPHI|nr:phosphoribosylanthranilate isomerase [Sphingobacterium gobiense]PRD54389.1 N-(5'-phosphoribosyl)anthranilate isomerase [Sphingobacterium gobiense]
MKDVKIKVCGMRDPANVEALALLPIDYMGFIFYEKSARYTPELPSVSVPASIKKVGVFVNAEVARVNEKIAEGLQTVQLHGQESPAFCEQLKKEDIEIIKAFGIDADTSWETFASYIGIVDYFLFDTSSPQHGGTGRPFNWELLESYPYDVPYFLSGGLDLTNIPNALAIDDERLIGLDINSKFEVKPGLKDIDKLQTALKIIRHE